MDVQIRLLISLLITINHKKGVRKMNFFNNQANLFKKAIKKFTLKSVVFNTMYHLLLQVTSAAFLFIWLYLIKSKFNALSSLTALNMDIETLAATVGVTGVQSQLDTIIGTVTFFIVSLLILIGIFAALHALFRGLMWKHFYKQRFTKQYYLKYLRVNLIWFYSCVILMFIIALAFKNMPAMILLVALFALIPHMNTIIGPSLAKKDKKGLIRHYTKIGIKNIHEFIIPYFVILIGKLIIVLILAIVGTIPLPYGVQVAIGSLLFGFYYGKTRYYIAEVVEYVESKK